MYIYIYILEDVAVETGVPTTPVLVWVNLSESSEVQMIKHTSIMHLQGRRQEARKPGEARETGSRRQETGETG